MLSLIFLITVSVEINGEVKIVDMELIGPYVGCIYHGGRIAGKVGDGFDDVVVFVAHFLPTKDVEGYQNIMENLFYYCMYATDVLVKDSYQV